MALCTLQSATPAHRTRWVKIGNFDQERVFCFKPLCQQWSLSTIFYSFWAPHAQKLWIGLFDCRVTKWCFWPACDQNLDPVLLRCDRGSNSQNFDLERLQTFTPIVLKVSLHNLLFGRPTAQNFDSFFLTIVRTNGAFDQHATKIYVQSFWQLCD